MQLTRTKKLIGGLALTATLMVTGIVGFAQQQQEGRQERGGHERGERHGRGGDKGGHGMRGGFGGHFFEKLNLTEAQQEQMKQIATRFHESTKALRQQERGQRGERGGGFDPLKDSTFNESAVRAAAQARANARVEMEVQRARMMSEMFAVLTPEQKTQLAAERQQREQKRQEMRSRRQNNQDQDQ